MKKVPDELKRFTDPGPGTVDAPEEGAGETAADEAEGGGEGD